MHPLDPWLKHEIGNIAEAWVRGVPLDGMPEPTRDDLIQLWGPGLGAHIADTTEGDERKLAAMIAAVWNQDERAAEAAMLMRGLAREIDALPSRKRKTGSRTWLDLARPRQTEWLRLLDMPRQHGGDRRREASTR